VRRPWRPGSTERQATERAAAPQIWLRRGRPSGSGRAMIRLNEPAPDFSGTTTSGEEFRLSAHRGGPLVLFFFPKAFTPG